MPKLFHKCCVCGLNNFTPEDAVCGICRWIASQDDALFCIGHINDRQANQSRSENISGVWLDKVYGPPTYTNIAKVTRQAVEIVDSWAKQ